MRLLSFYSRAGKGSSPDKGLPRLGALNPDGRVLQFSGLLGFPASMLEAIASGPATWERLDEMIKNSTGAERDTSAHRSLPLTEVNLATPLPNPASLRDFYAFEQHVVNAHRIRGKTVAPEWYQFPAFYFSNHHAIYGPSDVIPHPAHTQALDFEMEIACIIGKAGINISVEEAENHIFGYTILNDWSARDTQRKESRVGLGPAKGKDFATSLGPWIVTPDELAERKTGRPGVYDLKMTAQLNGKFLSQGNWAELHYSFGEMIARASEDAALLPGDVIGSGTVGNGCLLELTSGKGPWLQPEDIVEIEVERIGVLSNQVADCKRDPAGIDTPYKPMSHR